MCAAMVDVDGSPKEKPRKIRAGPKVEIDAQKGTRKVGEFRVPTLQTSLPP
jgi:hypothetical protein